MQQAKAIDRMDSPDIKAILIVEPSSQIRFRGPFDRPVSAVISLINPTDFKIIYKIKTSAPAFYGVRPNFGVVQPRNFVEVEIVRQPFIYDPKDKVTHRFLIQSIGAPSNVEDINSFWKLADPTQMLSSKLRCVFETTPVATKPKEVRLQDPISTAIGSGRAGGGAGAGPSNSTIDKATATSASALARNDKEPALQKQIDAINYEIRQLRNENTALRNENTVLKNEILQIRSLSAKKEEIQNMKPIIIKETKSFPFLYVLSSVTLVVACILIGKFFL